MGDLNHGCTADKTAATVMLTRQPKSLRSVSSTLLSLGLHLRQSGA